MNTLKLSKDITNIIYKYNLISFQDIIQNRKECLSQLEDDTNTISYLLSRLDHQKYNYYVRTFYKMDKGIKFYNWELIV